jgi:hypothetical protein
VTEFLITLALIAIFLFGFWQFLKIGPKRKAQRIQAKVDAEMALVREQIRTDNLAKTDGFGRKSADKPILKFVPTADQFPLEDHDGVPLDSPFGEDIDHPQSRTIPVPFLGTWVPQSGRDRIIFEPKSYQYMGVTGMQPVVAVRQISESEIAIVSQQREGSRWTYCFQCYGLIDKGTTLTDLENMDMKWVRA